MARELEANTFDLRLVGQPGDLALVWYGPSGDARHHTLPVCMRYRVIVVKPSGSEPSVFTDGKLWMREFFMQPGALITDYRVYLRKTLLPLSPPGVHIIASAPTNSQSATTFARSALELANQLYQLDSSKAQARAPRHAP